MSYDLTQDSSLKNIRDGNISILGCGWLGFPLGKKLIEEGFSIKGSTTSKKKIDMLQSARIVPFLIKLNEKNVPVELNDFLEHSETLIIDIPPGTRKVPKEDFVKKIQNILPYIEKSKIKNLLFISSTAVYEDSENFLEVTEESKLNVTSETAKQLITAEKLLQENQHFKTTILRFGGLIGEDRHPIHFLAGRNGIKNPKAPINLIDRRDCIQIILKIIKQGAWGQTFHAAYPSHPSKKEYYSKVAKKKKLPIPLFEEGVVSKGKIILSEKVQKQLGFTFTQHI